jgi:hypothetical protein
MMSKNNEVPLVIAQYHVSRLRHHVYRSGLLLKQLYDVPGMVYPVSCMGGDNSSLNGDIIPSELTMPFE